MNVSRTDNACRITNEALLNQLPHRPPFRFLTRVQKIIPDDKAYAYWDVTGKEPFLAGHFPSRPLVPGVLIGEALAQLAGLVVFGATTSSEHNAIVMLTSLDLRFVNPVEPPASIALLVTLTRSLERLHFFEVTAHHDDHCVCRGTLSLTETDPMTHDPGSEGKLN